MTLRRTRHAVLLSSCALVLAACGSGAGGATDGKVSVVTSFYPLQYVTERVAGDRADVTNLTAPGGEPHDLELSPKQVAVVQDADLVVYQDGFQTAVDEAVEEADRAAGTTVDAADGVDLIEESDEAHAEEEHGHEEEGHAEEGHDHGHDHGGVDPHLWLDPTNLEPLAEHVRDALAEADPDHAAEYEANAAALVKDLDALDQEFRTGLETCEVRDIVTSHAAFAYLARAYDLVQIPIAGIDPGTEPSAAQLAEITDLVKEDGITTVFTETLVSPAVARTVAREAGVRTATLDPIEGLSDETADEDYLSIMRANLAEIQKANSCS
jgi:zinc transport system substrate-binding protein